MVFAVFSKTIMNTKTQSLRLQKPSQQLNFILDSFASVSFFLKGAAAKWPFFIKEFLTSKKYSYD